MEKKTQKIIIINVFSIQPQYAEIFTPPPPVIQKYYRVANHLLHTLRTQFPCNSFETTHLKIQNTMKYQIPPPSSCPEVSQTAENSNNHP